MKSILYVGATLMIGASIYGFVDYKKKSHDKTFTGMYESKELNEPVVITNNPAPAIEEKTEAVFASKKVVVKTEPAKEEEITTNKTKIEIGSAEKIETDPVITETVSLKDNGTTERYKKAKKRKLNVRSFSRAPLREEREILTLPVPIKEETKKTGSKEQ